VCRAQRTPRTSSREAFTGLQGRDTQQRAKHRAIDIRADSGLARAHERRGHGVRRIQARAEITDRHAALDRRTSFLAGDAHEAAHGLHRDVERALSGVGSLLAVARDRAVDDPRIARLEIVITEAEPWQHAGPEILDDDIGHGCEFLEACDAGRVLEVDGDRPLVAVHRGEILAERLAILAGGQRRPAAHPVAA
jgi:hypothetical protein